MALQSQQSYRIGIALSGGGARGFAHVGALKAIEEQGIKPDVIAGVSAGSIVAVLYSAGVSVEKMMKLFTDVKLHDLFTLSMRGGGFFHIDKFKHHIRKVLGDYKNLEDLPIPTYIGVTDLDNGVPVEFHTGDIIEIMAASCSIPILFHPIKINGVRYVDGGVLRNLPAWIIRDKCEHLIGVNCSPLSSRKVKDSVIDIGMRTFDLMSKANQKEDMDLCDLAIEAQGIADYKVFNLKEIQQVYLRGYTATRSHLLTWPTLQKLRLAP